MNIDTAFGNWLAGFIDGEASFYMRDNGFGGLYCAFAIELRDDDSAIIEEIHACTGLGILSRRTRSGKRGNDKPQIAWRIQSGPECVELAELLERYPLRAKKKRSFAIWRKALDEQMCHYRQRGLDRDKLNAQMGRFKDELQASHSYRVW